MGELSNVLVAGVLLSSTPASERVNDFETCIR
jgi:hypothetical protein